MLEKVLETIDSRKAESVEGLCQLLRIPSISAQSEHRPDMARCADWLAGQLKSAGLDARIDQTPGHPIILAKNEHQAGRPTVLYYGHYDVQPPEPLHLWTTPAFDPTIRDNAVYARGASDDKGQVWAHVQAIRAWQAHGGPPINLILLIEGEEEIGSDHLEKYVHGHRDELRADIAVISDTHQFARGMPAITYGLRGLVYMEVFITAADHDLHSGIYGGAVPNPANILCELLATLHDSDGRVNLEGFYDDVQPLADMERSMWGNLPFDEKKFTEDLKLPGVAGEQGFSTLERRWGRPTCDINGLTSGYQGEGAKTIVPSAASAKVSMRLVPDQDPIKIQAAFEKAMKERCPATVKIRFAEHGLGRPMRVPMESRPMQLAAEAVRRGFGASPIFMREGGSIPVCGLLKQVLGIDTLLLGFGLPDDRVHSPNEKFDLEALHQGTRTAAVLYGLMGDL